jgi:hypothetical protein
MKFIIPKSVTIKASLIIFVSLFLFSAIPYFLGPGLTTSQPIGSYLNGDFPAMSKANQEPYAVTIHNRISLKKE